MKEISEEVNDANKELLNSPRRHIRKALKDLLKRKLESDVEIEP